MRMTMHSSLCIYIWYAITMQCSCQSSFIWDNKVFYLLLLTCLLTYLSTYLLWSFITYLFTLILTYLLAYLRDVLYLLWFQPSWQLRSTARWWLCPIRPGLQFQLPWFLVYYTIQGTAKTHNKLITLGFKSSWNNGGVPIVQETVQLNDFGDWVWILSFFYGDMYGCVLRDQPVQIRLN